MLGRVRMSSARALSLQAPFMEVDLWKSSGANRPVLVVDVQKLQWPECPVGSSERLWENPRAGLLFVFQPTGGPRGMSWAAGLWGLAGHLEGDVFLAEKCAAGAV